MLMTLEEFDLVTEYDDGFRYELIRGVMVVAPQQSIEVIVTEHETYQTPLLPGFELPLLRSLAAADRWGWWPVFR